MQIPRCTRHSQYHHRLDDFTARKRLHITLSGSTDSSELLSVFIRLADHLVKVGRFRPEVQRKLKATRDAEISKIKKVDDEEKAEARKTSADKKKRDDREKLLKGMTADQQRKFLDKEREKERKKREKRSTMRGEFLARLLARCDHVVPKHVDKSHGVPGPIIFPSCIMFDSRYCIKSK